MEVRRYCGHCLREVESGQTLCSSCDHVLPTTYTRRSSSGARTAAPVGSISSLGGASSGDTASDRIPDETAPSPLVSLDETIVRIQSSPVFGDDESVGWREGQMPGGGYNIYKAPHRG